MQLLTLRLFPTTPALAAVVVCCSVTPRHGTTTNSKEWVRQFVNILVNPQLWAERLWQSATPGHVTTSQPMNQSTPEYQSIDLKIQAVCLALFGFYSPRVFTNGPRKAPEYTAEGFLHACSAAGRRIVLPVITFAAGCMTFAECHADRGSESRAASLVTRSRDTHHTPHLGNIFT